MEVTGVVDELNSRQLARILRSRNIRKREGYAVVECEGKWKLARGLVGRAGEVELETIKSGDKLVRDSGSRRPTIINCQILRRTEGINEAWSIGKDLQPAI